MFYRTSSNCIKTSVIEFNLEIEHRILARVNFMDF